MLPKAEGCCTGLQLSAKEVVLGRPDMVSPALPQRRSPLSSSCLRPPPRPGGPACRSLARSAAGDGWNAPHETPGPPLPPPGKPPPLSVSVARRRLLLLLLPPPAPPHAARSSHDHPSRPRRWVREPPPPGAAPERGGFAGPRCPHPGRQSHGAEARGPAPPIPPPPRFSPFICFIYFFLFFSSFSSFSSFPRPCSSPSPSPLREAAGNGTIFFPGGGISGHRRAEAMRQRLAIGSGGGGGIRGARRGVRRPGGLSAR